ncbi:MAG: hypothetical protein GC187_01090 [Alphaproteobacteria bacterium]|nr:hypothetical protein [Alphaproteobacteria bacterium]
MDAASGPFGLADLIAPHDAAAFLNDTYEQRALHVRARDPERFRALISTAEIDRRLACEVFRDGEASMARAEPKLAESAYINRHGVLDRGQAARLFQQGATLILPQLHTRVRALADLCRALEADLSAHVQTNIYLTPPNAQGFQTHYDNHCVLVLQVEGEKRWRLYDSPVGAPYRGERFTPGQHAPGEPSQELVLKPGDVLYVPRGLMHDAVNEGSQAPSLHVTTGVITRTWADFLLEAVSEAALRLPELRRSLPPGFHRAADPNAFQLRFIKALRQVEAEADIASVIGLFADEFVTSRTPDTLGALLLGPITDTMQIRRRALIALHLAEDDGHIAVTGPGGPVMIDLAAGPALERFVGGEVISAADFAMLGEDKARDAIARLLAFGHAQRG